MLPEATPETARDPLLSLKEAEEYGPWANSTLRKKISAGELEAEKIGRRVYVRQSSLDALAEPVIGRPTKVATIESAIDRLIAAAPRLTDDQRSRLAPLMAGGLR